MPKVRLVSSVARVHFTGLCLEPDYQAMGQLATEASIRNVM
jgi:hypothetical protein